MVISPCDRSRAFGQPEQAHHAITGYEYITGKDGGEYHAFVVWQKDWCSLLEMV